MKHCIPDWNMEADFPLSSQRGLMGSDDDLVELLWQNGQVVMHSQTHRKQGAAAPNESKQVTRHDEMSFKVTDSYWSSSNLIEDDDTVSWIQFPVEDPLEKDFCSNFFTELSDQVEANRPTKDFDDKRLDKAKTLNSNSFVRSSQPPASKHPRVQEKQDCSMPPPKFQMPHSVEQITNSVDMAMARTSNFFGYSDKQFCGKMKHGDVKECSIMTVGSSYCGSSQITNEVSRASSNGFGSIDLSSELVKDTNGHGNIPLQHERIQVDTVDPNTSSSGGSGSSFMQSAETNSHKRKARTPEDSECQSDAVEVETAGASKQPKRSGSSRRSRAAEVHNLSERRRRDRINEKMKALQELIPNSNKSDKASMLDEAIEYMKSLQLQLQMMWMGSSMTPMMFPGIQHYMSRMGMGVCAPLPTINTSMHLPRVPLVDQSFPLTTLPNPSPVISPLSFQNQLQSPNLPEQYAHYLAFHNIQAASQPASMFGVQALQHNQTVALPGTNSNAVASGAGKYDCQGGKQG